MDNTIPRGGKNTINLGFYFWQQIIIIIVVVDVVIDRWKTHVYGVCVIVYFCVTQDACVSLVTFFDSSTKRAISKKRWSIVQLYKQKKNVWRWFFSSFRGWGCIVSRGFEDELVINCRHQHRVVRNVRVPSYDVWNWTNYSAHAIVKI